MSSEYIIWSGPELVLPERKFLGTLFGIQWFEDPSLPPGTMVMRSTNQSVTVTGLEIDAAVKP